MRQMSLARPLVWMAVLGAALATADTARTENFWNPDWFPLPGQAVFDHEKQQIAAVSRAPGNLDLFVIGFDNKVWTTFWNDATGWNADWFPLPGQAVFDREKQQIAAVSRAPGNLDLFVIGFDNKVWTTFWPNAQGRWNADWFPLPGQAVFDREKQQIAAVSRAPGNLDLFVIGFDNKVWTTFWAVPPAHKPFGCAFCNDGTCQCGSETDEELCASHSGVDPELGCIQQE